MTVVRSVALFALAAVAEIGSAWLVLQGVREHRGLLWVGAGVLTLGAYGFVATLQPDPHFGRVATLDLGPAGAPSSTVAVLRVDTSADLYVLGDSPVIYGTGKTAHQLADDRPGPLPLPERPAGQLPGTRAAGSR